MALRSRKNTIAAAGASLALAAAMIGGSLSTATASAWAATNAPGTEQVRQAQPQPNPQPGPGRGQWNGQDRQQMQEAYEAALAARLNISVDQLKAAQKQARIDQINKAVTDGKLTQDQANRMIQAIQSGQRMGPGMHPGGGQPGQGQGQGQRGPGQRGPGMFGGGQAVADLLGMTPDQIRTEMQAGKSLAQIAQEKGVSRDALKAKILEAQKARLDGAVAAGRMTAEQAQQIAARMSANIDRMLDATPGQRRGPQTPGSGN